jgi:hypothetical protein
MCARACGGHVGPCYGLAASYTRIGKERVHVTTLTQSPSSGKRLGPRCTGGREKAGVVRWRTSMASLSSLVPSTLPRSPSLSIPPRQPVAAYRPGHSPSGTFPVPVSRMENAGTLVSATRPAVRHRTCWIGDSR